MKEHCVDRSGFVRSTGCRGSDAVFVIANPSALD